MSNCKNNLTKKECVDDCVWYYNKNPKCQVRKKNKTKSASFNEINKNTKITNDKSGLKTSKTKKPCNTYKTKRCALREDCVWIPDKKECLFKSNENMIFDSNNYGINFLDGNSDNACPRIKPDPNAPTEDEVELVISSIPDDVKNNATNFNNNISDASPEEQTHKIIDMINIVGPTNDEKKEKFLYRVLYSEYINLGLTSKEAFVCVDNIMKSRIEKKTLSWSFLSVSSKTLGALAIVTAIVLFGFTLWYGTSESVLSAPIADHFQGLIDWLNQSTTYFKNSATFLNSKAPEYVSWGCPWYNPFCHISEQSLLAYECGANILKGAVAKFDFFIVKIFKEKGLLDQLQFSNNWLGDSVLNVTLTTLMYIGSLGLSIIGTFFTLLPRILTLILNKIRLRKIDFSTLNDKAPKIKESELKKIDMLYDSYKIKMAI